MNLKTVKLLIAAGAILVVVVVFLLIRSRVMHNKAEERATKAEIERAEALNDFHKQEGVISGLQADTSRLGATIREQTANITLLDKSLVMLLKREKQAINENRKIMLFTDSTMDAIYRARFPAPDSIRGPGATTN